MTPEGASASVLPEVRWGADGLVPAIVQDVADGRVLMLGWMDDEALRATLETREVHFHSRSRGRLWRKGETSGNLLRVVSLAVDCDADAILLTVDPAGPTCHTGSRSCFDATNATEEPAQGFGWLEELWGTIASRAAERPEGSYTARLLAGGVDAAGRKVTEEATEVLIAAKDDAWRAQVSDAPIRAGTGEAVGELTREATRGALAGEAADLLYHLLVLLAERDLPPASVLEVLRARHSSSAVSRSPQGRREMTIR